MNTSFDTEHWPTEIRFERAERVLHVTFDDDTKFAFPAEFLRVLSPSAEVQGHTESQRQTVAGRRHVGITGIEQVGNYAIRITFDDLHDSGIYSWSYLYGLGRRQGELWRQYLAELEAKGLSRDPLPRRS